MALVYRTLWLKYLFSPFLLISIQPFNARILRFHFGSFFFSIHITHHVHHMCAVFIPLSDYIIENYFSQFLLAISLCCTHFRIHSKKKICVPFNWWLTMYVAFAFFFLHYIDTFYQFISSISHRSHTKATNSVQIYMMKTQCMHQWYNWSGRYKAYKKQLFFFYKMLHMELWAAYGIWKTKRKPKHTLWLNQAKHFHEMNAICCTFSEEKNGEKH